MKGWTPDHIRLAASVERVRGELRRLAAKIGGDDGAHLGRLAAMLTAGLKARTSRTGAEMLPMLREEARQRMLSGKHHEDPRAILPEGDDDTGKAVEIAARILNTGAEVLHG